MANALLDLAASQNGFENDIGVSDGSFRWHGYTSTQVAMRIWLLKLKDAVYVLAVSQANVLRELSKQGVSWVNPLPEGAVGAVSATDRQALDQLVRAAFLLARTLPTAPLDAFQEETRAMPSTTEVERQTIQRVGQDIFRKVLLKYWDERCAATGLAVPALLRASHIRPWADCETDAQRLDVSNGFLFAAHVDAAFDCGLLTVAHDGALIASSKLDKASLRILGLDPLPRITRMTTEHAPYLAWHRAHIFDKEPRPASTS